MRLDSPGRPEGDVVPPAPVREGVVAGDGAVAVDQVLAGRPLCRAGHRRLLGDQPRMPVESAGPPAPAVVDVAPFAPVRGDGMPVQAVPPGYVAEVGLDAQLPAGVQLSHDVPLPHVPPSLLAFRGTGRAYFRWRDR